MKKLFSIILGVSLILTLCACSALTKAAEKAESRVSSVLSESSKAATEEPTATEEPSVTVTEEPSEESEADSQSSENSEAERSGIRPEFKEAMDSYEAFFNEYAAFMKKYSESDNTATMLVDYAKFMSKYSDVMSKMEDVDEDELSDEELAYYTEVSARIYQTLAEAAS